MKQIIDIKNQSRQVGKTHFLKLKAIEFNNKNSVLFLTYSVPTALELERYFAKIGITGITVKTYSNFSDMINIPVSENYNVLILDEPFCAKAEVHAENIIKYIKKNSCTVIGRGTLGETNTEQIDTVLFKDLI